MWNVPTREELDRIPRLYQTEDIPLKDKLIYLHFFIGSCDWFIAEYDGEDLFWGYAILNDDHDMAEWGYLSFTEMKEVKIRGWLEIDRDMNWQIRKASEIDLIRNL
jgi:Protein of unknown function (DUF2958)